jgi:hypothetical protein
MVKENNNRLKKGVDTEQSSEPSSLPPPYVNPVPIPARRRPSSTQHDEFCGHPGSKGKQPEHDEGKAAIDSEKKGSVSNNGKSEKDEVKESVKANLDDDFEEFWGEFEMG